MNTSTILIVEDFEPLRNLFAKFLRGVGYNVIEAATCNEALHYLYVATPDVALFDLNLPDGHGLNLIRYMRTTDRCAKTPIVVITGNDQYQYLADDYNLEYYLYKPVSVMMLQTLIERITATKGSFCTAGV